MDDNCLLKSVLVIECESSNICRESAITANGPPASGVQVTQSSLGQPNLVVKESHASSKVSFPKDCYDNDHEGLLNQRSAQFANESQPEHRVQLQETDG